MIKRIDYDHGLTADQTYEKACELIPELQKDYGDKMSNPELNWNKPKNKMRFKMVNKGNEFKGVVKLHDRRLQIESDLPWAAILIWGKIEKKIREKLNELFKRS
jgi:hypothetical protein